MQYDTIPALVFNMPEFVTGVSWVVLLHAGLLQEPSGSTEWITLAEAVFSEAH